MTDTYYSSVIPASPLSNFPPKGGKSDCLITRELVRIEAGVAGIQTFDNTPAQWDNTIQPNCKNQSLAV